MRGVAIALCFVAGTASAEDAETYDNGLAQQPRQQISSRSYGFVEHDPGQIGIVILGMSVWVT